MERERQGKEMEREKIKGGCWWEDERGREKKGKERKVNNNEGC